MKIRIYDLIFVSAVAFVSWFVVLSLDYYIGGDERLQTHTNSDIQAKSPFPDNSADNIFWFLQISDIHISYVNNLSVSESLLFFCQEVVGVIKPSLILVTGDLTHAKFPDERRSQQFPSEWLTYQNVVQKCNLGNIPWLDIRGNHDDFNVHSYSDSSNFFREYSMSWKKHKSRSYCYAHHTSFGVYNFIAIDACPDPGPRRPYNFFGILNIEDILGLKKLSSKEGNHTVWFTHYPSATITTDHYQLQQLMATSIVHVCGHLHTFGGLIPQMYGRHSNGHLELELGDFKDNKLYRLMGFDHDLFSFVDTTLDKWPLVMITNPKDAKYLSPTKEPTKRMLHSTHVRLLVFSTEKIVSIKLFIDGLPLLPPAPVNGGPLFVSPWEPSKYSLGLHDIKVEIVDAIGRINYHKQSFSLDGTISHMDKFPQLLLLTDLRSLFRFIFVFLWLTLLCSLILTWINYSKKSYLYNFVSNKKVFYPYLLFVIYFGLGPWYVGELITNVYGVVCVHGLYFTGHFLPGSMTYLNGILLVLLVHYPLLFYLNHMLSHNSNSCLKYIYHFMMIISLLVQLFWGLSAYPYGYVALIVSPGGTWPVAISLWLIYKSLKC